MLAKLQAFSMYRYNGGVRAKRQYGSSTITDFLVKDPATGQSVMIKEVGGRTPGERKTRALKLAAEKLRGGTNLGAPDDQHQRRATVFILEALRKAEKARAAGDCRTAFDRLTAAERAYGGGIAEASGMYNPPQHLRSGLSRLSEELEHARKLIASRCLR